MGVGLLALHALEPCNRLWPQLGYCLVQEITGQDESPPSVESEPKAAESGPGPTITTDLPDVPGYKQPIYRVDPAGGDVVCGASACSQDNKRVAPPAEGASCAGGVWINGSADPAFPSYSCITSE